MCARRWRRIRRTETRLRIHGGNSSLRELASGVLDPELLEVARRHGAEEAVARALVFQPVPADTAELLADQRRWYCDMTAEDGTPIDFDWYWEGGWRELPRPPKRRAVRATDFDFNF